MYVYFTITLLCLCYWSWVWNRASDAACIGQNESTGEERTKNTRDHQYVILQDLPIQTPVSKELKVSIIIITRKAYCLKHDIVVTSVCSISSADGYENLTKTKFALR